jgi:hypothetical protein
MMIKLFTAVGSLCIEESIEGIMHIDTANFTHVVQADDADEAADLVLEYYHEMNCTRDDEISVAEIEIFDFISKETLK